MTSLVRLKKILGLLLFLLLFFISVAVPGRAETQLTNIQKQEDPNRTRLTFFLSAATGFSLDQSGQRVDLILENTAPAEILSHLPEDGTIVRMTLIRRRQDLMVSLLLRRSPTLVVTESQSQPSRIILDLDWRGDESTRPAIAFRIGDLPPRIAGAAATRFQQQSPWDGHWEAFFKEYRSGWDLRLPLEVTLPPPPQLIADSQSPLWILQQHADDRLYLSLLHSAAGLLELTDEERYLRDLMVAEAYLLTGSYEVGLMRLGPLQDRSGVYQSRVDYLTGWGELARQNAIAALLHLQTRLVDLPTADPPAAVRLLTAEAALATAQYSLAQELLKENDMDWPQRLAKARQVRMADALLGLQEPAAALEIYRHLSELPVFCDFYRSSCNRAAFAAFEAGEFAFAKQLYQRLALEFIDQPGADLIHYAAGATAYETGDLDWGWIGLEQVTQKYPDSEGGDRARLRLNDISIISGGSQELASAVPVYARLGKTSAHRQIREEGAFKEALALFLLERHHDSVVRLMSFKRDFRSSPLRREADLLLGRQLPLVVDRLLSEQRDLEAVVLVEQNRKLLLAGGYDRSFLHHLATAFDRLGLYDRAARVLLYLFDHSADSAARRDLYLPLATSYLRRDLDPAAADYARQYLEQYADGPDAGALFIILIDTLERRQQHDEVMAWVQRPDRPRSAEAEIRVARIYWQQENFSAVVTHLERAARSAPLEVKEMARLAEAHYRLDNLDSAKKYYRQLLDDAEFGAQASYRNAQLLLRLGDRTTAVEQLRQVVNADGTGAWGKLARDLLNQQTRRSF